MPSLDPLSLPSTDPRAERLLPAVFYMMAVENKAKSAAEGRPIFDDVEMINILRPGDNTTDFHTEVQEKHKRMYPAQYAQFKQSGTNAHGGTLLSMLTFLTPRQIKEFEALNIYNVEALALINDNNAFMGWREIKNKAVAYLEMAKDQAVMTRWKEKEEALELRAKQQDEKITALTDQVAQLIAKLGDAPEKRGPGRPRKDEAA